MNPSPAPDSCPRCAGAFTCGRDGPAPCTCGTLTLSPALLARLQQQYRACLCLPCLRELAAAEPAPQAR